MKFKKYIVWVNYDAEGWRPVESKDSFDDASIDALAYMGNGNAPECVLITENIPYQLVPAKIVKEPEVVYRGR